MLLMWIFELQEKTGDNSYVFVYIVLETSELLNVSVTRCPVDMWFVLKCSILNE